MLPAVVQRARVPARVVIARPGRHSYGFVCVVVVVLLLLPEGAGAVVVVELDVVPELGAGVTVVVDDVDGGVAGGVTTVVDDVAGGVVAGGVTTVVDDGGVEGWQAPRASSTLAATEVEVRRVIVRAPLREMKGKAQPVIFSRIGATSEAAHPRDPVPATHLRCCA